MKERLLVIPPEGSSSILRPLKVFDEGGLNGLTIDGADDEVGEATVVVLVSCRTFSESDELGECGGVVACSYVGKLLVEVCHLLAPHAMGEGVLGEGCIEGGLSFVRFALDLFDPFEGGLGHLLSQYGSEVGGEAIAEVRELRKAGDRGNGEIRVKEVVDEGITEARWDSERWGRRGDSRRLRGWSRRLVTFWRVRDRDVRGFINNDGGGRGVIGHE